MRHSLELRCLCVTSPLCQGLKLGRVGRRGQGEGGSQSWGRWIEKRRRRRRRGEEEEWGGGRFTDEAKVRQPLVDLTVLVTCPWLTCGPVVQLSCSVGRETITSCPVAPTLSFPSAQAGPLQPGPSRCLCSRSAHSLECHPHASEIHTQVVFAGRWLRHDSEDARGWRHLADAHTRASQTSFVPELTDDLQYRTEKQGGALHDGGERGGGTPRLS